jgi:hypothetical protein
MHSFSARCALFPQVAKRRPLFIHLFVDAAADRCSPRFYFFNSAGTSGQTPRTAPPASLPLPPKGRCTKSVVKTPLNVFEISNPHFCLMAQHGIIYHRPVKRLGFYQVAVAIRTPVSLALMSSREVMPLKLSLTLPSASAWARGQVI